MKKCILEFSLDSPLNYEETMKLRRSLSDILYDMEQHVSPYDINYYEEKY